MSSNLPQGKRQSLVWLEGIIAQWNTNKAGIGLTSAQVIDLTQDIIDARDDFTTVEGIRNEAKVKTQEWYSSANDMRANAAAMITTIKGFADSSETPNAIYTLAGLTAKAPPTPAAAPTTPTITSTVLNGIGTITVNFSGTGPMGTVWQVSRKLFGETSYSIVGSASAATKSYTDTTVPVGTDSAMYTVQGVRGSISGIACSPVTAQFGSVDGQAQSEAA